MTKVLIVEDDEILGDELRDVFLQWGFVAITVASVNAFWEQVQDFKPQLIVVDLTLPDGSGVDIIRDVRSKSDIGIIVMSGRSDEIEPVVCIETGADDYVVKPFSSREMVARIRQLMYRTRGVSYGDVAPINDSETGRYKFNDFIFDTSAMALTAPSGDVVSLTTLEFSVLKTLVTHAREVLSRDFLLESVHAANWAGSDRNIDNLVSRIRKKMTAPGSAPPVRTVRGVGYMFALEVEAF
ncbi:MAG: response regulator transcription factor [Halieaceae bacterium]|jgi:two-component system, OmpR family, response regulator|nr:response regulator transcription factor [Halieaceae bacterium]